MPSRRPTPDRGSFPGWEVLGVISGGGLLGALARFGLAEAFPTPVGAFAWTTLGINVVGCLLIGVLMVLVERVWHGRPLVRPFLGIGVLGGFTTFSTYVLDANRSLEAGRAGVATAYLAGTLLAAVAAVWTGAVVTRRIVGPGAGGGH
jgi:CrcB protein